MSYSNKKKPSRSRRNGSTSPKNPLSALAKSVLIALPVTMGVGLLLLIGTTALLLCTKDPGRYNTVAGLAVLYVTALLGGGIATWLFDRRSPALCGTVMGLILFLLLCIPPLFSAQDGIQNAGIAFLARLALLPAALLGALTSTPKKKKRRR